MSNKIPREDLVDAFGQSVGVEKGRDIVRSAAETVGLDDRDTYAQQEAVDICEAIHEAHSGYIAMVAHELQVRYQAASRFQALLENIPDPTAIVEFEPDGHRIRMVNTAFETVFGYTESEAVGRMIDDLIVPPEYDAESKSINANVRSGDRIEREVVRETADGERRDFLLRGVPVETTTDDPEGYAIYTDITDQKRRERKLQRQNEQLDRFASVVSHDLRNPLNVAQGRLELVQQTGDMENLEAVEDAHERMQSLINDLLALARQGQTVGEPDDVALADLAEHAWDGVDSGDATLECPDELDVIRADPERLAELLANLFRNAIDHTSSEVTVTVGLCPDGFFVADDGPGVPQEDREQVLEHGYTTAEEGTGFGLSIVQNIAEAHGWKVAITDSEDGGARFEFTGVEGRVRS